MKYDVRELLHEATASAPDDHTDLGTVLRDGRRRVRRRRRALAGGVATVAALAVGAGAWTWGGVPDDARVASTAVPRPEGPVLHLDAAVRGVEGTDYDLLASRTDKNLDAENGQRYDGVTDDGRLLLGETPLDAGDTARFALLDPATGERDPLGDSGLAGQPRAVELGRERIVLVTYASGRGEGIRGAVYDRGARTWTPLRWPGLPATADSWTAQVAPDGRLYVTVPVPRSGPPAAVSGSEDDQAGAEGETYDLWSVSLTDPSDVEDEQLRVGSFAFSDEELVWSAATNGTNDRIHVRDLASGVEHDFDPRSGERCNLLSLGATADRIVLSQYCGTYDDGRDDRVQVLTTDGRAVTTIQDSAVTGFVAGGLVQVTSHDRRAGGTYVYDLDDGRLVRVSDGVSSYALGGPTAEGYLLWDTPVGSASSPREPIPGATQWLARWHS